MYLNTMKAWRDETDIQEGKLSQPFTGWSCFPFNFGRAKRSTFRHELSGKSSPHLRPTRCFTLSELKLLELLMGMKSFDRERHQHHEKVLLADLMRSAYRKGWKSVKKRVDPHILNEAHDQVQKQFLDIALSCVEVDRLKRPTMREVETRLQQLVQRRPPSS